MVGGSERTVCSPNDRSKTVSPERDYPGRPRRAQAFAFLLYNPNMPGRRG